MNRLFPPNLPARQWVTFPADGFGGPVTGVIYRNGDMFPGIPLGGIGTGFITLGADGTLDSVSTIFNSYMERRVTSRKLREAEDLPPNCQKRRHVPTFPLPFLGISVDGKTNLLSLQQVEGVEGVKQIDYWGHYPVADLEYDLDSPVDVFSRVWTPFLPGQEKESNIPGVVFEVRLKNTSSKVRNVTIALSFHGPRAIDLRAPASFKRQEAHREFTGQVVSATMESREYSYALGMIGQEGLRFGGALDNNGDAWSKIAKRLPAPVSPPAWPPHAGTSIALDFVLKPEESRTLRFVLAWYAPQWKATAEKPWDTIQIGSLLVNMYSTRFDSAGDVATYLARNHNSLLDRILAWQQVVYGEKQIPGWLQDSLINVTSVLAQESFWVKSANPDHWWGEEGFFCVNESLLSCPQQSCIANDEFGEWVVNLLFPELGLRKLTAFKHYQKKDTGQTPSTLGPATEPDRPWYDQQLAIDGQVYVHMIDRYRLGSGDDRVLNEWYPSARAAMEFMFTVDKDHDGLPDIHVTNHYLDGWPMEGIATYVSTYWLSTLRIAERMAKLQGDKDFADKCSRWYDKAYETLQRHMWNESVGSYLLWYDRGNEKKSDTVINDQLIGDLWAFLHGLPRIISAERTLRIVGTLERLNFAATPYGIRLACRPDGSEDRVAFYSPFIIPSYSTLAAASAMVRSGDPYFVQLGVEVVRQTWHNMVTRQNMAWDMPCMLKADGTRAWGMEYYHNTMLWTFPLVILNQDIRTACSDGGFINRIHAAV